MIVSTENILKEKVILLEKDNREKIKKVFGVSQELADWAHNIDSKLSIWIMDQFLKKASNDLDEPIHKVKLNPYFDASGYDDYLNEMTEKMVSIRDYLRGNQGIDYKNVPFDTLYRNSVDWHNSLRGGVSRSIEDPEDITILKQYEPKSDGTIFYWADLNTNYSEEESNRMGHCGRTNSGNTLLSLRSYRKNISGETTRKSYVTISVSKNGGYYTQAKGKQNRKPSIVYRSYIFDVFMLDNRIGGYRPEYGEASDWKVTDFTTNQIKQLYEVRKPLVTQYIKEEEFQKAEEYLNTDLVFQNGLESAFQMVIDYSQSNSGKLILNAIIQKIFEDKEVGKKLIEFLMKENYGYSHEVFENVNEYLAYSGKFSDYLPLFKDYSGIDYNKRD